jgi:hypothetical protein
MMLDEYEWWDLLPTDKVPASIWERRYLDKVILYPFTTVDGLGTTNVRVHPTYFWSALRWDPLTYRTFAHYRANPAPTRDIILQEYLESGLEFFAFVGVENVYVTYKTIQENDNVLLLLPPCLGTSLALNCTILDPPAPEAARHEVVNGWYPESWPGLALPVFLRLEPGELQKIKEVFEENPVTTLTFSLSYVYPRERQNQLSVVGGVQYLRSDPTNRKGYVEYPNFFTFRKEVPSIVRLLVATDLHVADRFDSIVAKGVAQMPKDGGSFCNCNDQGSRLATAIKDHWKKGEIDYAVITGDLVDYDMKDSFPIELNFKPVGEFVDDPMPFGMGEHGADLGALLDSDAPGNRALGDIANRERARLVLEQLTHIENTTWQDFDNIFRDTAACVRTFMIPGNHDYQVFGSELLGLSQAKFNELVAAIEDDIHQNSEGTIRALRITALVAAAVFGGPQGVFAALAASSDSAAWTLLKAIFGDEPPEWSDSANYGNTGLTSSQAECYDGARALTSNYRAVIGGFWAEAAATCMGQLTGDIRRGHSSHEIPLGDRVIRLGLFDTGPNWNILGNRSPWLRGFPVDQKAHATPLPSQALQQLARWRDDLEFERDTLLLFMHAPPVDFLPRYDGSADPFAYGSLCFRLWPYFDTNKWLDDGCNPSLTWVGTAVPGILDSIYGAPLHGHRQLLRLLAPELIEGYHKHYEGDEPSLELERTDRERPVLVFAGHTHMRNTFSLDSVTDSTNAGSIALGCAHLRYGNGLLDELRYASDSSVPASNAAKEWWRRRSLIVTSGCVGPIPLAPVRQVGSRLEEIKAGDAGFTPPSDRQGYYIVTLQDGVVTRLDWHSLWYQDAVSPP